MSKPGSLEARMDKFLDETLPMLKMKYFKIDIESEGFVYRFFVVATGPSAAIGKAMERYYFVRFEGASFDTRFVHELHDGDCFEVRKL